MRGGLGRIANAIIGLSLAPVLALAQIEEEPKLELALWDKSIALRGALGYKDNVLLSSTQTDGSPFWQTALDISVLRLSLEDGPNLTFFLAAEDRRYFSAEEIEKEQLLLSQARIEQPFLGDWTAGATLQYLYANQVFDASSTEQVLETLPVRGHNLQFAPALKRSLPWNSAVELKFVLERQYFNEPLDDYWEIGPQLTFSKKYGHRSEVTASYTFDHRAYDTRQELDLEFQPVPDTSLVYYQHEFELGVNHSWDAERHWRSRLRFLFEVNDGGNTGFYDYYRFRLSKRFGYYGSDWEAVIEGKMLHYDYQRQPVLGTTDLRSTWEYVIAARARKTVWKNLSIFTDFEYEVSKSNYSVEEYTVTTALSGVDWEF